MFRLNRNERSHWSGNGVHVESELVFMIGRNMHALQAQLEVAQAKHKEIESKMSPDEIIAARALWELRRAERSAKS